MNKEAFISQLSRSSRPVIVDFWASWCMPCRISKPILEELAQEFEGRVDFQVIDADQHQELLRELKILSIPTLLVFDHKQDVRRITGMQSPQTYRRIFASLAGEDTTAFPAISNGDRLLRLTLGAALVVVGMQSLWWIVPIGLLIMFLGIYDRCPIWRFISTHLKEWAGRQF